MGHNMNLRGHDVSTRVGLKKKNLLFKIIFIFQTYP